MPKFRKRPVVIEAHKYLRTTEPNKNHDEYVRRLVEWCGGVKSESGIIIPTLEGAMTASPGDYIIKGVNGEFYPCKPDIFDQTYEYVDE